MRSAVPSVASHPSAISSHAHLPKVRHAEADSRQDASPFVQLLDSVGAAADSIPTQPAEHSRKAARHLGDVSLDRRIDSDAKSPADNDAASDANTETSEGAPAHGEADAAKAESAKQVQGVSHARLLAGSAQIEAAPAINIDVKSTPMPRNKPVDGTSDVADMATDAEADPATDADVNSKLALELANGPIPAPVQDSPAVVATAPAAIPAELPAVPAVTPGIPSALPATSAATPAIPNARPAVAAVANDTAATPEPPDALPGVARLTAKDDRPFPLRARAAAPIADAMPGATERDAAPGKDAAPRGADREMPAAKLQIAAQPPVGKTDNETPLPVWSDAMSAMAAKVAGDAPQDPASTQPTQTTANAAATSLAPAATALTTAPQPQPQPQPVAVPLAGLAVEIVAQTHAGKQRFEIRLDPPELGRIDVRLDVDRHGHVTSRLVVERAETLDLLKRDASELQRALQQAGLKTSDNALQFSLRQQTLAHHDSGTQQAARVFVPEDDPAPLDALRQGYGRLLGLGGGLDIRV
jgi:flagellar hook-length control protein FliK